MIFLRALLRASTHPVTLINLMMVGMLCMIGIIHNRAHHTMEVDADSYVFNWCKKNPDKCKEFLSR